MLAAELWQRLRTDGFAVLEPALERELVHAAAGCCERVLARKNRLRTRLPLELHARTPFRELFRAVARSAQALPGAPDERWVATECWIRSSAPGGSVQRVHRDQHVLAGRGPAFGFDVLLTDFTEENGATELWPGTHALPDLDVPEASSAAERAALLSSVRIVAPAGSIVARDLRAWHRATPNRTDAPRLMLSVAYAAVPSAQPTS